MKVAMWLDRNSVPSRRLLRILVPQFGATNLSRLRYREQLDGCLWL